jgi:cysteinyl-tRNA synthetase
MSWKHLGETFDIHGGGIDLVFPHHENEIAQSRCAFHTPVMANYWMHNGFLQVEGEKMSKSEGNFVTIRDLLTNWSGLPWPGDAIRLAMLMTHYAQPLDWTAERVAMAAANLHTFHNIGVRGLRLAETTDLSDTPAIADGTPSDLLLEPLLDDLNTPAAILSHLFALVREADHKGEVHEESAKQLLIDCRFLGVDPFRFYREERLRFDESKVTKLIEARNAARKERNFEESDRIRDELGVLGVEIEDHKDGTTTWKPKKKAIP